MLIHARSMAISQDSQNVFGALGLGSDHEEPALMRKRRRVCVNNLVRQMAICKVGLMHRFVVNGAFKSRGCQSTDSIFAESFIAGNESNPASPAALL
jgi:hypothetical protein